MVKLFSLVLPLALAGLVFASCTKTVTETVDVKVYVHDTTHDTVHGPTLMRFISMLPDGHTVYIKQVNDPSAPVFLAVPAGSTPRYVIVPDSGVVYYLYLNVGECYDSVPTPVLAPNSIWTCALFKDSSRSRFELTNDSAKLHAAPAGKCYMRFVNGLAQLPPSNPQLFLDLDSQSPFQENGQPVPVGYGSINEYTLIAAGSHNVIVRSDQKPEASMMQTFDAGAYYTVRAFGQTAVQLAVDQD